MFTVKSPEVRMTAVPVYYKVQRHFILDGIASVSFRGIVKWSHVASLKGKVKIMPLASGRWSIRSGGRTFHTNGSTKVIVDGNETTVESHYYRGINTGTREV